MVPLPLDDDVHTISKIMALWSIPDADEVKAYQMPNALLAHTGSAHSLEEFIAGFVLLFDGQTTEWTDDKLSPLVEFVYSLRAPENPNPPEASLVATGDKLFAEKDCVGCHDGARGSSREVYTFDEIGSTDDALARSRSRRRTLLRAERRAYRRHSCAAPRWTMGIGGVYAQRFCAID